MNSNPLMMDYGGGDLLLAGAAGFWVIAQACVCTVQALGGDLNTAWRLSFSDESALEVSVTQDALYKLTSYLTLPYLTLLALPPRGRGQMASCPNPQTGPRRS